MSAKGNTATDLSLTASPAGAAGFDIRNRSASRQPIPRISTVITIHVRTERFAGDRDCTVEGETLVEGAGLGGECPVAEEDELGPGSISRRTCSTKAAAFAPSGRRVHCTSRNF